MTASAWHEEAITRKHDRGTFDCGDAELNVFLMRYARQSHDQGGAKTFLAIDDNTRVVLGFYSVAPASLAYHRAPDLLRRGLARHEVPGFRLARIAIDRARQGQGLGGQLLLAAGRRCLAAAAVVGGFVEPVIRGRLVAHRVRPSAENIADQSLRIARPGRRRLHPPVQRLRVIRLVPFDIAEQPGGHPALIPLTRAGEIDRRQQGLRIDPLGLGRLLEPNRRRRPAGRDPASFQIGLAE